MNISAFIRDYLPDSVHTLAISLFNYKQYRTRHSGEMETWYNYYRKWDNCRVEDWTLEQNNRLKALISHAKSNSIFYREHIGSETIESVEDLKKMEPVSKLDILNNLDNIICNTAGTGIRSETGGTTGNSLTVFFTPQNAQERFGLLKHFRGCYGYSLGSKAAWFSGKELLSRRNVNSGKFFKDDLIQKIRYFSTFHITEENFDSYWKDLSAFAPPYYFGFPSSLVDLCRMADQRGMRMLEPAVAFFSTSEVVSSEDSDLIERVLGCKTIDQYASAEGAPFILQCTHGNLHIHPLTGVFEVVDEDMNPAIEGELLVTSFTSYGTPLIRYRIGDRITLENKSACTCGSSFPRVKAIDGRRQDYLFSTAGSRINAVNISNSSKHVLGMLRFQIEQSSRDKVFVRVQALKGFDSAQEKSFVEALKQRLGQDMLINLKLVESIPRAASGKYRVVINHLIS